MFYLKGSKSASVTPSLVAVSFGRRPSLRLLCCSCLQPSPDLLLVGGRLGALLPQQVSVTQLEGNLDKIGVEKEPVLHEIVAGNSWPLNSLHPFVKGEVDEIYAHAYQTLKYANLLRFCLHFSPPLCCALLHTHSANCAVRCLRSSFINSCMDKTKCILCFSSLLVTTQAKQCVELVLYQMINSCPLA